MTDQPIKDGTIRAFTGTHADALAISRPMVTLGNSMSISGYKPLPVVKVEPFCFLPGEHVLYIVGQPGPDTEPCEVVSDDGGENVVIRYKVYGRGKVFEKAVPRKLIIWLRGSETSKRWVAWLKEQA